MVKSQESSDRPWSGDDEEQRGAETIWPLVDPESLEGIDVTSSEAVIDLREAPSAPPVSTPAASPPAMELPVVAAPVRPSRRGWLVAIIVAVVIVVVGYVVVSGLAGSPLSSLSSEVVDPGEVSLSFPAAGTISQLAVHPGERVASGQVLATEVVPGLSETRHADQAAIAADTSEVSALQALIAQMSSVTSANAGVVAQAAQAEVAAARQALTSDESQLASVQAQGAATVAAAQSLLGADQAAAVAACSGVGPTASPPTAAQVACADAQHRVAADELALAQAKASSQSAVDGVQSLIAADQRALSDAEAQASESDGVSSTQLAALKVSLVAAQAQLARDQGELNAAAQTAATQTLRAPIAGTVVSVDGAVGETVSASGVGDAVPSGSSVAVTPGFTLFPSTQTESSQPVASTPVVVIKGHAPTYLETLVPESVIGKVHLGDQVTFTPSSQGIGVVHGVVEQIFPRPVVAAGVVSYEVQSELSGRLPAGLLTGLTGNASISSSGRR
ncbi:hypothetical protein Afer_0463 [Acidimicrobium ferrooxidans DSM 10331]|uniref:Secretion protein HlyD family protein n=1 Tax=Acidimicrobium ferrooxidans (strain DSM 10331 / JCM 15462 / NBRC 103882 / ICP) TaxID=525909 RepID=C7M337_ACIFD|nr:hypothetical protein [Acidimicrobium ferrooxidans]ACU53431.1 hypothetical protein Afer_0463 [Acidimicrobium ferrooxidans DSM 10331]